MNYYLANFIHASQNGDPDNKCKTMRAASPEEAEDWIEKFEDVKKKDAARIKAEAAQIFLTEESARRKAEEERRRKEADEEARKLAIEESSQTMAMAQANKSPL